MGISDDVRKELGVVAFSKDNSIVNSVLTNISNEMATEYLRQSLKRLNENKTK